MIELNLLPDELKKKRRKITLPKVPIIPIAAVAVVVLVLVQVLVSGLVFLNKRQLADLDKEWQALAPKKAAFDGIKAEIAATGKKTRAIEDLMRTQINWSRILNEISQSVTPNIWLTELKYSERTGTYAIKAPTKPPALKSKGKRLVPSKAPRVKSVVYKIRAINISGLAAGKGDEATTEITRFVRMLKNNRNFYRDFEDIEIVSIKQGSVKEEDVMVFTLECHFRTERPGV